MLMDEPTFGTATDARGADRAYALSPSLTVSSFLRQYHLRAPNIMWFLGAGTSAAAGIPTANNMIWDFRRTIYCSTQRVPVRNCPDLGDPSLRARLRSFFEARGAFPPEGSDEEYAAYFEAAYPNEADRRRYLQRAVESAVPSYGHVALAALAKLDKARTIWTTNFDRMVEDAIVSVFGSSGKLVVAALDNADLAKQAIDESRFPLLVKLHGDFHSRRLKNTDAELRNQDGRLRAALVDACKRNGLAVVGYSGRDSSVMDALDEAATDGGSFPFGLYWFHRPDHPPLPRVLRLISTARTNGIEAHLIEAETFDEVLGDLLHLIENIPPEVAAHLDKRVVKVSDAPLPAVTGAWPVVRLNALAFDSFPTLCRRVCCEIGGAREVRDAVQKSGAGVVAGRRNVGVIAFGSDSEIRRAFAPYSVTEFDTHTIEPHRLRYESAEMGLLYDAICKAIARERPLLVERRRAPLAALDPTRLTDPLLKPLLSAVKDVTGTIPGTQLRWSEGITFRLDFRLNRLWLLFEPAVWVDRTGDGRGGDGAEDAGHDERIKLFVQRRHASRFNSMWNGVLDAWSHVLAGGQDVSTLRSFGISDGLDATFTISRITAFSRRGIAT